MIFLGRHGLTGKNKKGGTDDFQTPLEPEGEQQATDMGTSLYRALSVHDVGSVTVITSQAKRAVDTAHLAMARVQSLAEKTAPIVISDCIRDVRLGEIDFTSRDSPATFGNPGFFNRRLTVETRAGVHGRLYSFYEDYLIATPRPGHALVIVGHRGSNQILMEDIVGVSAPLGKKNNCELWRIDDGHLRVIHDGIQAERDAAYERPKGFREGQIAIGTIRPIAQYRALESMEAEGILQSFEHLFGVQKG